MGGLTCFFGDFGAEDTSDFGAEDTSDIWETAASGIAGALCGSDGMRPAAARRGAGGDAAEGQKSESPWLRKSKKGDGQKGGKATVARRSTDV